MARYLISALLPALLFLGTAGPAAAQRYPPPYPPRGPEWQDEGLSGQYVNTSNGGQTEVRRRGDGYVFVNENGTPAGFEFVGPRQLRMVWGDWNPDTMATVTRDRSGRPALRFQEPGQRPSYWVKQDY
jgi:hypothetical protein